MVQDLLKLIEKVSQDLRAFAIEVKVPVAEVEEDYINHLKEMLNCNFGNFEVYDTLGSVSNSRVYHLHIRRKGGGK